MKHRQFALGSLMALGAVASFSATAPATALEPTQILPVFRSDFEPEDKLRHTAFANFPGTPGQETLGLSYSCTASLPDVNGMVKTTVKTRFVFRPAAGGTIVFAPAALPTVVSLPYPDPNNDNNQCLGSNQTDFDQGDFPGSNFQGCPRNSADQPYQGQSFDVDNQDPCRGAVRGGQFFVGIGTGGNSTNYVVFSDVVSGRYRNASTGGNQVDLTNYAIHVYSMNGTRVWTKSFPGNNTAGHLEPVLCGVGDFLNDDGVQELRVARIKEGTGSQTFTYYYYDLDTGALITQAAMSVSAP